MALQTGNLVNTQPKIGGMLNVSGFSPSAYANASNAAFKSSGITTPAAANTALSNKLNVAPIPIKISTAMNTSTPQFNSTPPSYPTSVFQNAANDISAAAAKTNASIAAKPPLTSTPPISSPPPTGSMVSAPIPNSAATQIASPPSAPATPPYMGTGSTPLYSPSSPPTYPGLVSNLANASQQVSPDVDKYRSALAKSYSDEAQALANIEGSPHTMNFAQGAENVIRNQYLQQQQGFSTALNSAVTSQGQQLGAMGTAAGLAQPSVTAYGQAVFNPLTQNFGSGGGQYGTGPAAAANVASIQQQTQSVNDYAAARQAAQGLSGQLNDLITSHGVNPSDFNAVNHFIQEIMGQVSSPEYQTFQNIVNDLAARYAQILTPAGGSTTDMVRTISQSLVNATASGQSIQTVLSNLDAQAQKVISGYQSNINNLNTGQNVNAPATAPQNQNATNQPLTWASI